MPNAATFKIPPIRRLIYTYNIGMNWADPYCGESIICEHRNDYKISGIDSLEWIPQLPGNLSGAIVDPPYSPRQMKEHYQGARKLSTDYLNLYARTYRLIAPKIIVGGVLITCGWNSNGFGRKNGFKLVEVLLVAHGGAHHDTIVTVEIKLNQILPEGEDE